MTQSAFSRSIQSLEEELGGRLVDRIGKRNALTPLGDAVLGRARQIVRDTDELRRSAELFQQGSGGAIRVGLGSGPGALLMTPLLCEVAEHHAGVRVSISRGSTELQVLQLRARTLEALVVDARRVAPAPDLLIEPLLEWPIASTPLSTEVARLLVEQYGPAADPTQMTTLQCEDVGSLIDAVSQTDAVFLGIVAAAREGIRKRRLVELKLSPRMRASAAFAYVTLAGRTQAPVMQTFRSFVSERMRD
jgi:DNA-binding transcriptional LysR family regulator